MRMNLLSLGPVEGLLSNYFLVQQLNKILWMMFIFMGGIISLKGT